MEIREFKRLKMLANHLNHIYVHLRALLFRLNQLNDWNEMSEDVEVVTVNIRRNPTFGFHVMGGVGAGGNPYRAQDDGVFITHVTPGGAADGKLQAGDKILLVSFTAPSDMQLKRWNAISLASHYHLLQLFSWNFFNYYHIICNHMLGHIHNV